LQFGFVEVVSGGNHVRTQAILDCCRPFLVFAIFAMAQQAQQPAEKPEKVIKHVPLKATSAASGHEMFKNYCAVCHGTDAKGNGPAAAALKIPPTDLTALAQKAGGKYPALHVTSVIGGEAELPAHGSKDMPVWGPLLFRLSQGHEGEVPQRIANLNQYIEGMQQK
jgi:mono/diheme cytochrome c family protein